MRMEEQKTLVSYRGVAIERDSFIVLRDVCFEVVGGELVYLIGKVGSGKTSLIKTLYADVPVTKGDATVLGYDMANLRRKDIPYLRRNIGIVFQDYRLLPDRSVFDNLDFVLKATDWRDKHAREERIESVLREVGLINKSYKMPHELSGGEQQRVVIARALLNDPDLILADEPTGNLDPETGELIFGLLASIAEKGKGVILSTHNHAMISRFPGRVLLCEDKCLSQLP